MLRQTDDAVSEVVSFLLVIAVIAAGIAISMAVVSPELEKSQNLQHQTDAVSAFVDLKTGIDQLWIFDKPEITASLLLPFGTIVVSSPQLSFNHSGGQTTANLLTLSYTAEPNINITYEGGTVFTKQQPFLKHSTGDAHAILICFEGSVQTLTTNRPILIQYVYHHAQTYTNVSTVSVSDSTHARYWREHLSAVETLTLIDYTIHAEAVV